MADGKWITGVTAATPPAEAARRVLAARLKTVQHHLPLAIERPDEDPEHVHQLRVGTRRAGAALNLFADCLGEKSYRSTRRLLRRLRRAAGAARDADVFRAALVLWGEGRDESVRPGLDFLLGHTHALRATAQVRLVEVGQRRSDRLDALVHEIDDLVRPPHGHDAPRDLIDLAAPHLAGLMGELADATAKALAEPNEYARLHCVRIVGKRLRYAMEVFAGCFAPPLREVLYPAVEEMQELLGAANDSHVAAGRLADLRAALRPRAEWPRWRPVIEALYQYHKRRLPAERRRFAAWQQRWRELCAAHPLDGLRQPTTAIAGVGQAPS